MSRDTSGTWLINQNFRKFLVMWNKWTLFHWLHPRSLCRDEPKKEAKMEDVKLEVEDEEETSKPKAKNPLDLLPPNEMLLDEWKRLYSNTKTNSRGVAIKGTISYTLLFSRKLYLFDFTCMFIWFLKYCLIWYILFSVKEFTALSLPPSPLKMKWGIPSPCSQLDYSIFRFLLYLKKI